MATHPLPQRHSAYFAPMRSMPWLSSLPSPFSWLAAVLLVPLAACSTTQPRVGAGDARAITVPERYVSDAWPGEELDSLAVWRHPDGAAWLIASGKSSHGLSVVDAGTGKRLRTVGGPGTDAGRFDRPNGVAVTGDMLLVVERDNRRVQALVLPAFAPAGMFGEDVLRSPYGIWLHERDGQEIDAYVTDSFMYGERYDVVPPLEELSQRVRRFRLRSEGGRVSAQALGSFGDTSPDGALQRVESLAGDPANDRLLVADEAMLPRRRSNLREYTLEGRYTGRSLPEGSFDAEAEGVALWTCPDGGGYWVAVDQLTPLTRFHLFDRASLALRGTWQGRVTANTDGIALDARPSAAFPGGALFAVHQDRAIAAFDLREVVRALGLDPACVP